MLGNYGLEGLVVPAQIQNVVLQERADEKPLLQPYLENLCATLLQVMQFPADLEQPAFEMDRFVNLRELCATVTTEALVIVEASWMLGKLGDELNVRCAKSPMQWPEVEACMHILTAVAPRAEAGKDEVIPRMVELIPQLQYPPTGDEMLVMRCAAARFVMYTVGYLSMHPAKTFPVVFFLAKELLPSLYAVRLKAEIERKSKGGVAGQG